ncbi:hypothetical protein DAPPUDRAFT_255565 [Daphnia pulex]|uniref:Uncharacterized protein n=1 Tax=Daphnia pulex TaxID=6669 RepID=E9H9I1_DAPPU|nr:hypothetical protein DAPPUDRAFT_255565 [Daphnia pulex]|eukprot:EFX71621.1 hypothetical protein DAPPUDRAFT_255565 [Daphnia pulex]
MNISVARSSFMDTCGSGTEILVPMLTFVHDEEGLPPMSSPSLSSRRPLI